MTTILMGARQDLMTDEITDLITVEALRAVQDDLFWLTGRTRAELRWCLVSLEV